MDPSNVASIIDKVSNDLMKGVQSVFRDSSKDMISAFSEYKGRAFDKTKEEDVKHILDAFKQNYKEELKRRTERMPDSPQKAFLETLNTIALEYIESSEFATFAASTLSESSGGKRKRRSSRRSRRSRRRSKQRNHSRRNSTH